MQIYDNISNRELPTLLRVCYDASNGNMEQAAHDLETFDMLLGVVRMKSIISSSSRRKETSWSRGRNFQGVLENIILRDDL